MRLSLRAKKVMLSAAAGGCLATAATVTLWGLRPVADDRVAPREREAAGHKPIIPSPDQQPQAPTRESFAQLADQPLRRPLYDPPPPQAVVKQLPPLQVDLLGTILEGDNSVAIVRSEQGQVAYRRAGESVGPVDSPAKVVEIHSDAVVLERDHEQLTLRVQTSERR